MYFRFSYFLKSRLLSWIAYLALDKHVVTQRFQKTMNNLHFTKRFEFSAINGRLKSKKMLPGPDNNNNKYSGRVFEVLRYDIWK